MSHWTKSKVKIKDSALLKKAAEKLGCKVEDRKTFHSSHAGDIEVDMVISARGGQAALQQNADGTYTMVIDNWCNSITDVVGQDCKLLTREYTTELTKEQALLMGGVITSEQLLQDGSVEIEIAVL